MKAKLTLIILLLTCSLQLFSTNQINIGYWRGNSNLVIWGEGKKDTYDAALYIPGDAAGLTIESIAFPINNYNLSDYSIWLSTDLVLEKNETGNKVAMPNITKIDVDCSDLGWFEVNLSEPYTITSAGVYLGCTFTVTKLADNLDKNPLVLTRNRNANGLFLHTLKNYVGFTSLYGEVPGSLAMYAIASGDMVGENAANVKIDNIIYGSSKFSRNITATILNHGTNGLSSVNYSWQYGDQTGESQLNLDGIPEEGIGWWNDAHEFKFELPIVPVGQDYDFSISIDQVNGMPNDDIAPVTGSVVHPLNTLGRHRVVMESVVSLMDDATPRAYVGVDANQAYFEDDFIPILYHYNDVMHFLMEFPERLHYVLEADIDRSLITDPYWGGDMRFMFSSYKEIGERMDQMALADINATATWEDPATNNIINVTTDWAYSFDNANNNMSLVYILMHDEMGPQMELDPDWQQLNAYSGYDGWLDDTMDFYILASPIVWGITFNDVVLATSNLNGIEGSVPTDVKADVLYDHQYTFDLNTILNQKRNKPILQYIQNKDKLKVAVMLIDNDTNEIVNAALAKVPLTNSIESIECDNYLQESEYYTISGLRLLGYPTTPGIYIERSPSGSRKIRIR